MAYWLKSSAIAWAAACLSAAGAGKSGKPCARLVAPWRMARRVISRMTDSPKPEMRRLRKRSLAGDDTFREYGKKANAVKWVAGGRIPEGSAGVAASGPSRLVERNLIKKVASQNRSYKMTLVNSGMLS